MDGQLLADQMIVDSNDNEGGMVMVSPGNPIIIHKVYLFSSAGECDKQQLWVARCDARWGHPSQVLISVAALTQIMLTSSLLLCRTSLKLAGNK